MSKSVIANFMTFIYFAPQQIGISLAVFSHDEKRRRHILLFENIEDARRPFWIWSIVKGQRDGAGMISSTLDDITGGNLVDVVRFRADESGIRIDGDPPLAIMRARNDLQQFACPLKVNVISIRHLLERVDRKSVV